MIANNLISALRHVEGRCESNDEHFPFATGRNRLSNGWKTEIMKILACFSLKHKSLVKIRGGQRIVSFELFLFAKEP